MKTKYLSAKEMEELDKKALEIGLTVPQMMENVGNDVARFVLTLNPKKVLALVGKGNNGGDALAVLRFLSIEGIDVQYVLVSDYNENVEHQLKILKNIGIKEGGFDADVILDGLLGYNIKGNPRGEVAELIEKANRSNAKIVAIDIPSGMDPDTGKEYSPCIRYDYIFTLAQPKLCLKGRKFELSRIGIKIK